MINTNKIILSNKLIYNINQTIIFNKLIQYKKL